MAEKLLSIIIIFGVGYFAASIALKFKIPLARLIGPIIAIGTLKVLGVNIIAPEYLKAAVSIVLGCFFGMFFNKEVVNRMKMLILPCLFLVIANIIVTLFNGYVLTTNPLVDKATALFSVVPGGISEIAIIALSYQTDLVQVTTFHMARLLAVVLVVPPIITKIFGNGNSHEETGQAVANSTEVLLGETNEEKHWLLYIFIGFIGSIIFYILKVPSNFIIGSLVAVIIFNIIKKDTLHIAPLPKKLNDLAQMIMGGIIGLSFTQDSLTEIGQLFFPILGITSLIIGGSVLIAWLISKIYKIDFLTSLMASIPGGLLPMIIMAEELKADVVVVSTLQIVRLLTAVLIIPMVYSFLI